jgi:ferredoxin
MPIVSISDQNLSVEINKNDILFNALDDKGIKLPHGCLAGSCGACRIEILEGKENLLPPGMIETNTINSLKDYYKKNNSSEQVEEKCLRLSCRAKIIGDIKISTKINLK